MPDSFNDDLRNADLGDVRRNRSLLRLAAKLAEAPLLSICAACGTWAEANSAYRLLHSPATTPAAILAPHREAVVGRAAAFPCVLVVQDTTELDFTQMKAMQGCGPLNSLSRKGHYLHSLFTLSEAGLPLGLLDADIFTRSAQTFGKSAARAELPIEQKESFRWVRGYLRTQELAQRLPDCEVISISDREGDIYEVFAAWKKAGEDGGPRAGWIVRANRDRALEGLAVDAPQKLFAALESAPALGSIQFHLTAKKGTKKVKGNTVQKQRSARLVRQTVRAMPITPRIPERRGSKLPEVTFWALLAEETDPPPGEEPVHWLLLTSTPVRTLEAAQRTLAQYLRRWDIEVFHRVLKTGCRVEALQIKAEQAVHNSITLYAIIASRILHLTHLGRQCPELPASAVFEEAEWRGTCAVAGMRRKKAGPEKEPTLGEFMKLVAGFGGHLGRKSDGPPGAQAIWQGLARVRDFACGWEAAQKR
jgi:hypothetical protein